MDETVLIDPVFLDTDGYWKFSVIFDRGQSQAVHTFFYKIKAEADVQFSAASVNKLSLSDSVSINTFEAVQDIIQTI